MKNKNIFTQYPILKWVVGIIAIVAAWKFFQKIKGTASAITTAISTTIISTATAQYGVSPERVQLCASVADGIYKACWKTDFGLFEDEDKMLAQFKKLTSSNEAKVCALIYRDSFDKSLYSDLDNYLAVGMWAQLNSTYLSAIKDL